MRQKAGLVETGERDCVIGCGRDAFILRLSSSELLESADRIQYMYICYLSTPWEILTGDAE
jgi:hypothetical protein